MSDDEAPMFLSDPDMRRAFAGDAWNPKWELVLVAGHLYHREGDGWHRHDEEDTVGPT